MQFNTHYIMTFPNELRFAETADLDEVLIDVRDDSFEVGSGNHELGIFKKNLIVSNWQVNFHIDLAPSISKSTFA